MTFAREVIAGLLVCSLGVVAAPSTTAHVPARTASPVAAEVPRASVMPRGRSLPIHPADSAYDHERRRLFISGMTSLGTESSPKAPLVYDVGTGRMSRLRGIDGAEQLMIDAEGDRMFALRRDHDEVAVVSLRTLAVIRRYPIEAPGGEPAVVRGRLWLRARSGLGALDLSTGELRMVPGLTSDEGLHYISPWLLTSDPRRPDVLLLSSNEENDYLYRLRVSADPAHDPEVLTRRLTTFTPRSLQFTPSGGSVYVAGHGTQALQLDPGDLSVRTALDGTGAHYATLDTSAIGRVVVGNTNTFGAEILLFEEGSSVPYRAYEMGSADDDGVADVESADLTDGGLHIDGHRLFAITTDVHHDHARLRIGDTRWATSLDMLPRRHRLRYGQRTRLTAQLSPPLEGSRLTLRANSGARTKRADARGRVSFTVRPRRHTTYRVTYAGTEEHEPAQAWIRVRVRARLTNWWRHDGSAFMVRVQPVLPRRCVRVRVEQRSRTSSAARWEAVEVRPRCLRVDRQGRTSVKIPRSVRRSSVALRARARSYRTPRLQDDTGTTRRIRLGRSRR